MYQWLVTHPLKTKRNVAAVRSAPLDAGDNMPNMAKTVNINNECLNIL